MLPLIFAVLERGGVGKSQAEEADVQVVLALEFLAFHTDICMQPSLTLLYPY